MNFKLNAWAEQLFTLRVGLHAEKLHLSASGNPMTPTGYVLYPRYFKALITLHTAKKDPALRPEHPRKTAQREQVYLLRKQGMSYWQIANILGITVGTTWNLANLPAK